ISIKNASHYTIADDNGSFALNLSAGTYELLITSVGYLANSERVTLRPGETKRVSIRLKSDPNNVLDHVVVEGKTAIQEIRETPFNVVALDAKSLYNSTLDLGKMLDRASGIKIRETGGVGSGMSISLNGFTGRHVKLFMDGVPMEGFGS